MAEKVAVESSRNDAVPLFALSKCIQRYTVQRDFSPLIDTRDSVENEHSSNKRGCEAGESFYCHSFSRHKQDSIR